MSAATSPARKHKVTWDEPSGRQWGHPMCPMVEMMTRRQEFDSETEARAFAQGLRRGGACDVQLDGWPLR